METPAVGWHILVHTRTWEHSWILEWLPRVKRLTGMGTWTEKKKKKICTTYDHHIIIRIEGSLFWQKIEWKLEGLGLIFPAVYIRFNKFFLLFSSWIHPPYFEYQVFWCLSRGMKEKARKLQEGIGLKFVGFSAYLDSGMYRESRREMVTSYCQANDKEGLTKDFKSCSLECENSLQALLLI